MVTSTKKMRLLSTSLGSTSLRELAKGLSTKLGYKVWRSALQKPNRVHLKYGQGVDKVSQYKWFVDNSIPALQYTTSPVEAIKLLQEGNVLFGRKLLNSSCGKGIVVMEKEEDHCFCPVYTVYKKKKREFRVHVFKDKVVAVTEKKRRKEFDGTRDTKIRNLANGYVFVQSPGLLPDGLHDLALAAAKISPSDFRGVDIGYNEKANELFVIEVNSAPGIQGTNLSKYIEAITNV